MEQRKKEGEPAGQKWVNETMERKTTVTQFLSRYFKTRMATGARHYDAIGELHFSGSNIVVMDKIKLGTAEPIEVNVYYEDGEIKQIHAVYASEGQGHNIDVYITEKALEDYLSA